MRFLTNRTYAGHPKEAVTVDTEVEGGGHVTVLVDGVDLGPDPTFSLKTNAGDETHMRIALFGAVGDSCVVQIRIVDGGSDGDLLLVQIADPAPVHSYRFIVTSATTVAALTRAARAELNIARAPGAPPADLAAAAKKAAKRPARKRPAAKRGR